MPENPLPPELQARASRALPVKWADSAMYHSASMPEGNHAPGGGSRPTVTLLNATPDPLGSLAALCGIYEGNVFRSLRQVDDSERRAAWEAMRATVLNGPLEAIQFHFLVEGVTRAFTHQAVRNRFSFFAQESMRFAVVDDENWLNRQAYPPSLAAKPVPSHIMVPTEAAGVRGQDYEDNPDYGPDENAYALQRDAWDDAIIMAQNAYNHLVAAGVPAEEARGLMPHSMTTRYHWIVNVRALLGEAGKRLCTQAQFEWRVVMAEVVKALRGYGRVLANQGQPGSTDTGSGFRKWISGNPTAWQFELMADALQPVCYQEGRCGFMAKFDRGCTIRSRVEENAAINRPSSEWGQDYVRDYSSGNYSDPDAMRIPAIQPVEWLADPAAART